MNNSFISRWSKRKQEAKTAPESVVIVEMPAESPAIAPEEPPPELPPIESLGADSDYSAFLGPGVSPSLRQEALTRLWATDPTLMAPETMDLHMGDYSNPPTELIKTAWRLGKGVLDAAELAAEEEEAKAAALVKPPDSDC
ncbi:MAG: DUF3306 domain-containing protein [Phaeospirillum sp.]|nr:DUF3306 domain-containing protein [Phaeospirillum sp.]